MEYKKHEVLDIIKSCTLEDPNKILLDWNNKKANTPLNLEKTKFPHFVYSFPVFVSDKKVATITLVSLYCGDLISLKPDLMQKYFGHEEYEKSWHTFSHDTLLDCYITIHEEFELTEIVKEFYGDEFKSEDADGNEFRFRISYGYPEKEEEAYVYKTYTSGVCYIFGWDHELNIQILDEIKKGWSLGDRINENIKNRAITYKGEKIAIYE